MCAELWLEEQKERDHTEDQGVDESILILVLEQYEWRV
jgi:hypothetical protein